MDPREEAARNMMSAGIGSLSGNQYDGLNSQMTTSPGGNNYYIPNFNVVSGRVNQYDKTRNDNSSQFTYDNYDFVNPNTNQTFSKSFTERPNNFSSRFIYPDGSGYGNENGKEYPIQLKGPQTYRFDPGNNRGIQTALNNKYEVTPATSYRDYTADDYFLREFGQYMKRFLPGYDQESDEFRQREFRENQEEDNTSPDFIFQEDETGLPLPIMEAGMGDSFQSLQQQIDDLDVDSPNYDDMLELLMNDMQMKYPYYA